MKYALCLSAFLFLAMNSAQAFPIKSDSYQIVQMNCGYLLLSKDPAYTGIRSVADHLLPRVQSRSLFRLEVSFQGVPSREEALLEVEAGLKNRLRDGQVTILPEDRIRGEAYHILDSIIPSINRTDLMGLTAEIFDWYKSDLDNHLILRIQPDTWAGSHALVLVSFERERAQALVVEVSSPE